MTFNFYYGVLTSCFESTLHSFPCLFLFTLLSCARLSTDGQEFFTSYDEVYESFDDMGLQENLLRGIYAYGRTMNFTTSQSSDLVMLYSKCIHV